MLHWLLMQNTKVAPRALNLYLQGHRRWGHAHVHCYRPGEGASAPLRCSFFSGSCYDGVPAFHWQGWQGAFCSHISQLIHIRRLVPPTPSGELHVGFNPNGVLLVT